MEWKIPDPSQNLIESEGSNPAFGDSAPPAGRIALPGLIREMDSVTPKEVEEDERLVLNSSPAFITGIVNDLQKIGAIGGIDRMNRAIW